MRRKHKKRTTYDIVKLEVTVDDGDPIFREEGEEEVACLPQEGHLGDRGGDLLLAG